MTAAKKTPTIEVREIPIEQVFVSASETRKTVDQAALLELANSISDKGILEPLIVRLVDLDCMSGLVNPGPAQVGDGFEIVSGQRRWLAAKMIQLKTVPCIVRELSDDEAGEQRVVSNLQREDLPPMEEAEGFAGLLRSAGATVDSVAAKLGKAASYVARRLKLLDAIEPVREALNSGAIEVGHALELARLSDRQQQQLLEWLDVGYRAPDEDDDRDDDDRDSDTAENGEPGECIYCFDSEEDVLEDGRTWLNSERTICSGCAREAQAAGTLKGFSPTRTTLAELRNRIVRTELRVLRDVPFPLDDEIPPMACTACPKRASGPASLFADIAEDTCTDPECLDSKLKVWVKAQLESADRAGRKLLMLYDGSAQGKDGVSRYDCKEDVECESCEPAIWVNGIRIGRLVSICRDRKCEEHWGASSSAGASNSRRVTQPARQSAEEKRKADAQKAERAKLAAKVTKEVEYRKRLFGALKMAKVSSQELADRLIKQTCLLAVNQAGEQPHLAEALGWPLEDLRYGNGEAVAKRLQAFDARTCLHMAALALCATDVVVGEWAVQQGRKPERMEQIARWFGIDVDAVRSGKPSVSAKSSKAKKTPAKPAPKKAAAKTPAKKAPKKGGKK